MVDVGWVVVLVGDTDVSLGGSEVVDSSVVVNVSDVVGESVVDVGGGVVKDSDMKDGRKDEVEM